MGAPADAAEVEVEFRSSGGTQAFVVKTELGVCLTTNPQVIEISGATRRDRTGDLLITNQPLYQLS